MKQTNSNQHHTNRFIYLKTRWPAWLALFIVALLYEGLPKALYLGPRRLMIGSITVLIIPMLITYWRSSFRIHRILALSVNILITFYLIISVSRLVMALLQGIIGPTHLLLSSVLLWVSNILVFALWYWNLDEGGPNQRDTNKTTGIAAFLFPQAQLYLFQNSGLTNAIKNWKPNFVDYLFLAFNTSTAFSPTDTPVLSRWAKCMGMLQALISLTIVLMLAARAINILNPSTNYLIS